MTRSSFWLVLMIGFSVLSISFADVVEEIKQKLLKDHNKYRKLHHVLPLEWSDTVAAYAKDWADQLLKDNFMHHRPANKYGENLWTGRGYKIDDLLTDEYANPVNWFYAEIQYYPDADFSKWGHLTQLLWKNSKYLGCGISYDPKVIFVVCNYDPRGNWNREFAENVFTIDGAPWGNDGDDRLTQQIGFVIIVLVLVSSAIYFHRYRSQETYPFDTSPPDEFE